jgi:protein-S-isoprenylcysteine O-methyltransferase Ste14
MMSAAYPRQVATASATIAGVDLSSWLSWICYASGFAVATKAEPTMVEDLTGGGLGLVVIAGSVAIFFALVVLIQHQMNTALRSTAFAQPRQLVTSGLFAISRNPMYVAFLIPMLSLSVYSPLTAIVAAAFYVLAMNSLIITREEEVLAASFGKTFRSYCLETPRWLAW